MPYPRAVSHYLADVGETDQPIPLPNVSSSVLKKVRMLAELLTRFDDTVF